MALKEMFPRVKEAREALRVKAIEVFQKYMQIIDLAIEQGKLDVAAEHTQWLIEHMPAQEGERMIDPSAAKPKQVESGPIGPTIQIGFQLGGMNTEVKQLPPAIDVEPIEPESK